MLQVDTPLKIVRFNAEEFDIATVANRLTELKALASRTPTPVTVEQLQSINGSDTSVLLLQIAGNDSEHIIVGMVHLAIIYLEDRAHLGPICIDAESTPRGHGTPLMEAAIEYVKSHCDGIRRIDLSNRPSHNLAAWYEKFGFVERTNKTNDPTTMYRLQITK